jgi:NAD(P)-dependent dehydrogenase (short-subunit alcohol dehydrogenase family)
MGSPMDDPVLLVGAGGGLGAAVARRLVRDGRNVIGTVRSQTQIAATASALPGLQQLFALDLADADGVLRTLRAELDGRKLAATIVCAAECHYGPLELEPLARARASMEINAFANLAIFQACMPALRHSRGTLVLVSSNSGLVSMPFLGSYQASKFALEALGDAMRLEAIKWGVRVVLVEPGGMDTKMPRGLGRSLDGDIAALTPEQRAHYGELYTAFAALLGSPAASSQATPLEQVADLIATILANPDPEPRYPVGADTAFLLQKRRESNDREMDEFARSVYGLAPYANPIS